MSHARRAPHLFMIHLARMRRRRGPEERRGGPGLVGNPVLAVGLVVGIGLLAAGLTALYVRATGGPRGGPPPNPPSVRRR